MTSGDQITLADVWSELQAIRALLERRGLPENDTAVAGLVHRLAAQSGALPFSVAQMIELAEVAPELREAILAVFGEVNGKRIGKLLAKIEGHFYDGICIAKIDKPRGHEGAQWVCVFETRNCR